MVKSLLILLLPPAAILAVLAASVAALSAAPDPAPPLACTTVDGNTVCAGPGALSCQTVNGKTVCAQSGPSCRTGRGKDGCDSDLPIRKQRKDMPADDLGEDDESSPPAASTGNSRL